MGPRWRALRWDAAPTYKRQGFLESWLGFLESLEYNTIQYNTIICDYIRSARGCPRHPPRPMNPPRARAATSRWCAAALVARCPRGGVSALHRRRCECFAPPRAERCHSRACAMVSTSTRRRASLTTSTRADITGSVNVKGPPWNTGGGRAHLRGAKYKMIPGSLNQPRTRGWRPS